MAPCIAQSAYSLELYLGNCSMCRLAYAWYSTSCMAQASFSDRFPVSPSPCSRATVASRHASDDERHHEPGITGVAEDTRE
jgi:hypothetical protein